MKNWIKLGFCALLITLVYLAIPRINERYAALVVKEELALLGEVLAKPLNGGFGNASLYLASDGKQQFVVRFIKEGSPQYIEQQFYNWNIAGKGGYGPKIYFADTSKKTLIMEYLPGKKISYQDLQSEQLYLQLAHLLQKMHRGEPFQGKPYDPFKQIERKVRFFKNHVKNSHSFPLEKMEQIVTILRQALSPYLVTTPCHNDLHAGNLMFLGNEIKAIDYENAAQSDPYFDIATLSVVMNFFEPSYKKVLLTAYLGRQPTAKEEAKLYLMEQVVLLKWVSDDFERESSKNMESYEAIQDISIKEIFHVESIEKNFDLHIPENNSKHLKALLKQVFENAESEKFKKAIKLI